jgi:hypothetical protein
MLQIPSEITELCTSRSNLSVFHLSKTMVDGPPMTDISEIWFYCRKSGIVPADFKIRKLTMREDYNFVREYDIDFGFYRTNDIIMLVLNEYGFSLVYIYKFMGNGWECYSTPSLGSLNAMREAHRYKNTGSTIEKFVAELEQGLHLIEKGHIRAVQGLVNDLKLKYIKEIK